MSSLLCCGDVSIVTLKFFGAVVVGGGGGGGGRVGRLIKSVSNKKGYADCKEYKQTMM